MELSGTVNVQDRMIHKKICLCNTGFIFSLVCSSKFHVVVGVSLLICLDSYSESLAMLLAIIHEGAEPLILLGMG